MRILSLLVVLLAACSSGGGDTPSQSSSPLDFITIQNNSGDHYSRMLFDPDFGPETWLLVDIAPGEVVTVTIPPPPLASFWERLAFIDDATGRGYQTFYPGPGGVVRTQ